jgi:uncharacterized cofD-like protein
MKKITVIGGGTGTFVALTGLKEYPYDLSAIITMTDSGGSTGRLRDQLGVLPPGDLRQSLVALSEASLLWRKLFLYRFEAGDLAGHNFGNIFLSALEKVCKDYKEVIKTAGFILKIKGKVIPVTFDKTNLVARYTNGKVLKGEGLIDANQEKEDKIEKAYLEPKVTANQEALKTIKKSDYILIGPGDLYTSLIPVLLVGQIKEAIQKTKAKIIYIVNLMTKFGQTTSYKASDHLKDLEKYLGRKPDFILINNGKIPENIIKWYESNHEEVVFDDLNENFGQRILRENLISSTFFNKPGSDKLSRSVLRHSSKKLARLISKIINKEL